MRFFFANSCGYGPWDWRTPDADGVGNSETAQVEMTRLLAARGHEVVSFSPCEKASTHAGVRWLPAEQIPRHRKAPGVWVVSRSPHLLDGLPPLPGRRVWFVSQDVEYGDALTPERLARIDRLLALCPEHANYLRKRYPGAAGKVQVSSNGARVDLIERIEREQDVPGVPGASERNPDGGPPGQSVPAGLLLPPVSAVRNPFRVVHTSSPDRGLIPALAIFRRAREFEPRLELHVAYGFANLLAGADRARRKHVAGIQKQLDQPGVTNHGRLPQPELYRLLLSVGIWLYVTDFQETGCASHLEAMCAGCVPVFSPLWAMEHNGGHGLSVPGGADEPITRCRAARAVLQLAWGQPLQEMIRGQMVPWARRQFCWENVADQYEMMAREPGRPHAAR